MPDPDDTTPFETRDTEKMTPLPPIRRVRRRPTPPNPILERFLEDLASKVEREREPPAHPEESE